MTKSASLLFLLLIINGTAFCKSSLSNEVLFKKGTQLLLKGNYEKAITAFEELQSRGIKTPALFGNMAVAYFKTNQIGSAVLYNEKALLLSPFDQQLRQNRVLITPRVSDTANGDTETPEEQRTFTGISVEITFCGVVLLLIGSIVFLCWSFRLPVVWKSKIKLLWQTLILSGVFFSLLGGLILVVSKKKAIIMATTSEVRSGPGKLAKIVFELKEGEEVEVLYYYEKWNKIKKNDGTKGWIPDSEIAIIQ